jgi:hypothetical protein
LLVTRCMLQFSQFCELLVPQHYSIPDPGSKGKVIPLQAYGVQRVLGGGGGRLRLSDFVTSALEGGRLSAIRTSRLYPQEHPGTHFKRLPIREVHVCNTVTNSADQKQERRTEKRRPTTLSFTPSTSMASRQCKNFYCPIRSMKDGRR